VEAAVHAVRRTLGGVASLPRFLLVGLVIGYRRLISPLLGPRCRFYPSCSTYGLEALRVHGAVKGTALTVSRVCRCNPWNAGGVDHVPAKGAWTPEPYVSLESRDQVPPTADADAPRPDRPAEDRSAA
jgi:putative membrane protein insertion efficiency factor